MTTRMLIDARHREETRVAVVQGNRIEEFDFESAERKQLKGNIYLAKVTRVEPSLQAAFIDYGGNRHGFLAFSEIHPDYYQIPKEDREALLREEAEHAAEEEQFHAALDDDHDDDQDDAADGGDDDSPEAPVEASRSVSGSEENTAEALRSKRMALRRRYKIQDVIHRRQILLVQVVKEERGNKGAALTTYLSLAGRYCVLMPNTTHGGGISRKISNAADRKRLKTIMTEMNLPRSMGCIVRTAGLSRTKTEIKRDFDYLARMWDEVRETTLRASAPSLIYGDNDLVKRAIRDIYNREIDEVIVEGDSGHRAARDYMKLLMPSHARRVKGYADPVPLFQRFGVEDQLNQMYHPVVQLKSGGYLVINPTEALVSIDINSGRSTREHGIEATAVSTNLEAAGEIARQLRLRDMAGLVVIDFIDMENNSNVRKVEKAMKGALANDRARIQVGRISSFGLMEMSRQRLRTGVLEASTRPCPHCEGTGFVRTASSAGLSALRLIEEEAARGRGSRILLRASQEAAFYVLNQKRAELAEIEERYFVTVEIAEDGQHEGARMTVEASGPPPAQAPRFMPLPIDEDEDDLVDDVEEELEEEDEVEDEAETEAEAAEPRRGGREERGERSERDERGGGRRRRRRRGRRGRPDEGDGTGETGTPDAETVGSTGLDADADGDMDADDIEAGEPTTEGADRDERDGEPRRRGRRGRRGGRRNRESGTGEPKRLEDGEREELAEAGLDAEPQAETPVPELDRSEETAPRRRRRGRARSEVEVEVGAAIEAAETGPAPEPDVVDAEPVADAPRRGRRRKAAPVEPEAEIDVPLPALDAEPEAEAPKPRRARRPRKTADTPDAIAPDEAGPAPAVFPPSADNDANELADAEADAEPDADASGPARRGWWQRTFGA